MNDRLRHAIFLSVIFISPEWQDEWSFDSKTTLSFKK